MIPDIILNKIYWYLWRYQQTNICIEYHKNFAYHHQNYLNYNYLVDARGIFYQRCLTDRVNMSTTEIRNFRTGVYHHKLSKNYWSINPY